MPEVPLPQKAAPEDPAALPFMGPCRALAASAPLRWIRLGWQDLRRAPRQSLGYGVAIVLLSGFVFIAPVLALGLYSISRQLERGLTPSLARCMTEAGRSLGTAMVFALALLVLFLVWARAGSMVHVFFPVRSSPDWLQLALFLPIGSAVGSIFVALTAIGFATALIGLAVTIPVLGHATWHAYRETIDAGIWPSIELS